jgi:hypothetical protein
VLGTEPVMSKLVNTCHITFINMSGGCKFALGNFERKQITQKSRYGAEN